MYRVIVINISDGEIFPYDGSSHNWDDAVRLRKEAMEFFPAAIIEVV